MKERLNSSAKETQAVLSERIVLPLRERLYVPCGAMSQWKETLDAMLPMPLAMGGYDRLPLGTTLNPNPITVPLC